MTPELLDRNFPGYNGFNPKVPVWCLTPGTAGCMHRFFDTSPISPSGRFGAFLRLPQEERFPEPGERAGVVLVDLEDGSLQEIATTAGWEPQMGANINWGADDGTLFFNDVDTSTWKSHVVRVNPMTGERDAFGVGLYHASPDGRLLACCDLAKMRRTQRGYGVVVPDEKVRKNAGFPEDDGLWITDTDTGEARLVLSLREIFDQLGEEGLQIKEAEAGHAYGFHAKFSPDGERLIFTVRWVPPGHPLDWDNIINDLRFNVLTCRTDGSDLHNAVPANLWEKGGHHINWFPDSEHLSMNLGDPSNGDHLTLVQVRYDGSDLRPIVEKPYGSGHPTVHPRGGILADTYTNEHNCDNDGTSHLRWIDPQAQEETVLVKIRTAQDTGDGALRVDPHAAWDATWRYVAFNGTVDGTRRVYLADMQSFTG